MQIGEKKGLLDNDAALYSKRDDSKSAKKKFKELKTKKEKLAWLKAYALKPAIAGVLVLGFVIYIVYSIVKPKVKSVLNAAVLDYYCAAETLDEMEQDYITSTGLELGELEEVYFASYNTGADTMYAESAMTLSTLVYAGSLDLIIAPEESFDGQAFSGVVRPIDQYLTEEEIASLGDKVHKCKIRLPEEDVDIEITPENSKGDYYSLGITLDGSEFAGKYGGQNSDQKMVIGIWGSAKNVDQAVAYIKWIAGIK